jgi:hypothetical protein
MTYQVEIEFKGNRQRIISDSYNALKPLSPLNEAEFLGLRPGDKVVYWGPPILGGIPSRRYRGEFVRFQTENEVLSELLEEHTRFKKKKNLGRLDRSLGSARHPRRDHGFPLDTGQNAPRSEPCSLWLGLA